MTIEETKNRRSNRMIILAKEKGYKVLDNCGGLLGLKGEPIKLTPNKWGYPTFKMRDGDYTGRVPLHRFVAYCLYGDELFTDGLEVRHLNGNKLDYSFTNIKLGTKSENEMDKPAEERTKNARNAASKTRKFTDKEMEEIRYKREDGYSIEDLMEEYDVAKGTLQYILRTEYKTTKENNNG